MLGPDSAFRPLEKSPRSSLPRDMGRVGPSEAGGRGDVQRRAVGTFPVLFTLPGCRARTATTVHSLRSGTRTEGCSGQSGRGGTGHLAARRGQCTLVHTEPSQGLSGLLMPDTRHSRSARPDTVPSAGLSPVDGAGGPARGVRKTASLLMHFPCLFPPQRGSLPSSPISS